MFRRVKIASAATVDEDGHPRSRIINVMIAADEGMYIVTSKGKPFYEQLVNTGEIALSAMCPECQSLKFWGKVRIAEKEWDSILSTLAEKLPEMSYPMILYAKNNQGDTHIMTLLRSRRSQFFDENGRFNINTEEGIAALQWIADSCQEGYFPAGCENMEINDCNALFLNNQLAIYMPNSASVVNMDKSTTGLVNFPSLIF